MLNKKELIGCDINPTCEEALKQPMIHFPQYQVSDIPLVIGSILEQETIKLLTGEGNDIDIIHSWGVLHHTGNMKKSIQNASSLVKENGYLIISIYNKHWTSPIWLFIKWLYNKLPSLLQKAVAYLFYPLIWLAKYLVTGENPTESWYGFFL
ncbi:MAG: class I SAM-dependent methyltransferase [Candidatus Marithrix sp.]